jgi:L-fucose isomerase-like protein
MMSQDQKITFALFFGNRGFFPASLIAEARETLPRVLGEMGFRSLLLEEEATRYGAVETAAEGKIYAEFLRKNQGKFDGVILSLPNFGDENGAVTALKDAGVPILVQAYPDELDKMAPALRRDAFCGKLSVTDVFRQYGVKFSALKPHVAHPQSEAFRSNLDHFARVCQVVKGVKGMTVGAIGARTTPFKTVRIDEVTLQKHGITVETIDMSTVIHRIVNLPIDAAFEKRSLQLQTSASFEGVPNQAFENLVRLSVVLDQIIEEYAMDAVAIRCWLELQEQLGISPCVAMGVLNDEGFAAACEVDIGSAVAMHALHLASMQPSACLDWNNNYADAEEKCILFHCGPIPRSMMKEKGQVVDHSILANSVGEGCSFGPNVGRIKPFPFTFGNVLTENGRMKWYFGKGEFTTDPVPDEFFGCAGVAEIPQLEDVLMHIVRNGHRHHVNITAGDHQAVLQEALGYYLDQCIQVPQEKTE